MDRRSYFLVTAIVFSLIGLLHLLRIVLGWEAILGGWSIPMWLSWVAMIMTAVLAYYGFAHRRNEIKTTR
jgi:uncharacterized protein YacL